MVFLTHCISCGFPHLVSERSLKKHSNVADVKQFILLIKESTVYANNKLVFSKKQFTCKKCSLKHSIMYFCKNKAYSVKGVFDLNGNFTNNCLHNSVICS